MTITTTQAAARAQTAMAHQAQYNQAGTTSFGLAGGPWRSDCSGFICAVAGIGGGLSCPSTSELAHGGYTTPASRAAITPYRTVTLVTAGDGFEFGHVALITAYDKDRLQIMEHGGGLGPIQRWLPAGQIYDSTARYGRPRTFALYNMTGITGTASTTTPASAAPGTAVATNASDNTGTETNLRQVILALCIAAAGLGLTVMGAWRATGPLRHQATQLLQEVTP